MGDQRLVSQAKALLRHMLEHRVTVAKSALRGSQGEPLAGHQINCVERLKTVLQLNPIRANILHR